MPRAIASRSPPPVSTSSPFLPFTIAVPVSWHDGRTPPAAMHAFFSSSSATNAVVGRRLGVVEDRRELREVAGPQQVRDVVHRLPGQQRQRLGIDLQEAAAAGLERRHVVGREQAVRRVVGAERQHVLVGELGHAEDRTVRAPNPSSRRPTEASMARPPRRARLDGRGAGPRRRALGRADAAGGRQLPDLGRPDRTPTRSVRSD